MLMRNLISGLAALAILGAASLAAAGPFGFGYKGDHIERLVVTGNDFNAELARGYKDLALYERDEMVDWSSAERFSRKAIAASRGEQVLPEDPANYRIRGQENVAQLESARAELMQALSANGRTTAPNLAAMAQVKYDCWVEQQEEGWQTTHIAACRDDFLATLAALNAAMTPTRTEEVGVRVQAEQVVVYFEFDRSDITPQSATALREFVELLPPRQTVDLVIAGHTDRAGSPAYNIGLSQRRAEAVQNYLADLGVTATELAGIQVLALGESQPAIPTADGVRMPENRRVVVTVEQPN